jgi:hypothetical protein
MLTLSHFPTSHRFFLYGSFDDVHEHWESHFADVRSDFTYAFLPLKPGMKRTVQCEKCKRPILMVLANSVPHGDLHISTMCPCTHETRVTIHTEPAS